MENWSSLQIILALVAAIFIPALLVHFTLGRNGGHHLFEKSLSREEVQKLPFSMAAFRIRNNLIGSFSLLLGTAIVVLILNTVCNALGIQNSQDFWIVASIFSFLVLAAIRLFLRKK